MGTKPFWQSKALWGGVIASVASIGGLVVDPLMVQHSMVLVSNVVAGIGGLLAVWGRISAKTKLSL